MRMYGLFLVFIQFLSFLLLFLSGPVTPNNVFSFLFLSFGIILGLYALWTMRQSKIRVLPNIDLKATLITSGPYTAIRHPMYTALLLIGAGMVCNDISITRFIIYIVLFIDLIFKIKYEEKLLSKHFPEYEAYKHKTAKLIPFIY